MRSPQIKPMSLAINVTRFARRATRFASSKKVHDVGLSGLLDGGKRLGTDANLLAARLLRDLSTEARKRELADKQGSRPLELADLSQVERHGELGSCRADGGARGGLDRPFFGGLPAGTRALREKRGVVRAAQESSAPTP